MKYKKAILFGISNKKRKGNIEFSNFVYSLCRFCISEFLSDNYETTEFIRHDMLITQNIRQSVFKCIIDYNTLIFLVDELPLKYIDPDINGNHAEETQSFRVYNSNVWFELGISAPQEKNIILISLYEDMPFYARDVQPILLNEEIMNNFFYDQISYYRGDDYNLMESKIKNLYNDKTDDSPHKAFKKLINNLKAKFNLTGNPFHADVDFADINTVLQKLGYGRVSQLFEKFGEQIAAKFINGEENAFIELSHEVVNAKKILRTTRFANQSIVSNEDGGKLDKIREDFMKSLYCISKRE